MIAGTVLVALCCIGLGLAPGAVSGGIGAALGQTDAFAGTFARSGAISVLASPLRLGQISPAMLGGLVAIIGLGAMGLLRLAGAPWTLRREDTWGCGRIVQTARMEYTASAFAEPLRRVFGSIYRPTEDLTIETHPESRYFVREMRYRSDVDPWVERVLYARVNDALQRVGTRARELQGGSLHLYVTYVFCALLLLLIVGGWLG